MKNELKVKVAALDCGLDPIVYYQGSTRRRLPLGEAITVPSTSYYLRLIHCGALTLETKPGPEALKPEAPAHGKKSKVTNV